LGSYTAGEQVTDILREKILCGEIPDSTEFTQKWIAEQLGVSRMPIREALFNLEFEGLMERLDNRHTRIIGADDKIMTSRIRFLSSLECDAANSVAECEDLANRINLLASYINDAPNMKKEILFHTELFSLSEDRFYLQMYKKIAKPSLEILIKIRKSSCEVFFPLLRDILEKIQAKDLRGIRFTIEEYYNALKSDMR
jgi:DNA-binding GntR family transcriptional regulator